MDTPHPVDRTLQHDVTVAELRACAAFSHFTDEQANEVIETLKAFAKITYDLYKKDAQGDGK